MHQPPENKGGSRHEPETARTEELERVEGSLGTAKSKSVDAGKGVIIDSQKPLSEASKPSPNVDGDSTRQKTDQTGICPPLERQVGMFLHHGDRGKNVPLRSVLNDIRDGRWAHQINKLRALNRNTEEFKKAKRKLPCFLISGSTSGGHKKTSVFAHSGLLQIDIDDVEEATGMSPEDLRDRIGQDPHILAGFISPSGNGVKALLCIPASKDTHQAAFATAAAHFRSRHGVEIDAKCQDISRLCFVSHDPGLVLNLSCTPLDLPTPEGKQENAAPQKRSSRREAVTLPTANTPIHTHTHNSSKYLHPTSYILHNTFDDWPDLKKIYDRNITRYFGRPQRGQRNAAIVEISARMFFVVKPEFVMLILNHYRQEHHEVFADYSPADFEHEARAMLEGCELSFRQELTERERLAYLDLPEREKPAFRIARSLSRCKSDATTPPPLFHLSCHELAVRLGLFDIQAGRILQDLEKRGIIETVRPGTKRQTGQPRIATVWRWMSEDK
jgi:hypothetical protein